MSSESGVRISTIENPRIPEEGSSAQGKSGPKPRPTGVGDGQSVEIPILSQIAIREGVTQKGKRTRALVDPGQAARPIDEANPIYQS